jgi:hypothetical protein
VTLCRRADRTGHTPCFRRAHNNLPMTSLLRINPHASERPNSAAEMGRGHEWLAAAACYALTWTTGCLDSIQRNLGAGDDGRLSRSRSFRFANDLRGAIQLIVSALNACFK